MGAAGAAALQGPRRPPLLPLGARRVRSVLRRDRPGSFRANLAEHPARSHRSRGSADVDADLREMVAVGHVSVDVSQAGDRAVGRAQLYAVQAVLARLRAVHRLLALREVSGDVFAARGRPQPRREEDYHLGYKVGQSLFVFVWYLFAIG